MHIIIIGNGITGITCALNIRKMDATAEITVISAESKHFYSRTALMYVYMGHMKYEHTKPYEDWFWEKNRITLVEGFVKYIGSEFKVVSMEDGRLLHYNKLVIASGSAYNKFGWPGEDLHGVCGLYSLQDLQAIEVATRDISDAVIIGGGLIGIELAEMLSSRQIKVHLLVREKFYWSNVLPDNEAKLVSRHISEHSINLLLETELKEILGDANGRVKSIITHSGEEIPCQFVGLTAGVSPQINFIKNSGILCNRGVLVNQYLETNIPNIYAAGDCAEFKDPQSDHPAVEQLWYTGKLQGEALAKVICGQRIPYNRGIWFNSAKFLDIEYQTYGIMLPQVKKYERTFYWEDKEGKRAFRATYNKNDQSLTGLNFLGLRFRQAIAEEWICKKKPIVQCIQELKTGWFDPEFSKPYYLEIISAFQASFHYKPFAVN